MVKPCCHQLAIYICHKLPVSYAYQHKCPLVISNTLVKILTRPWQFFFLFRFDRGAQWWLYPVFFRVAGAQKRSGKAQLSARVAQVLHVCMYGRSNILKNLLTAALSTTKRWPRETLDTLTTVCTIGLGGIYWPEPNSLKITGANCFIWICVVLLSSFLHKTQCFRHKAQASCLSIERK